MDDLEQLDKVFDEVAELEVYAHEGLLSWKVVFYGLAFAVFLFGTAMPAVLLYQTHPRYRPLCVATLVIDTLAVVLYFIFGWRWYFRTSARVRAQGASSSPE
jgi:hypothetical protein